jgi:hypothetical protein
MYMRVGRGRIDPANIDKLGTLLPDIIEAFDQLPGYVRGSLVAGVDRATGEFTNVSLYDTEEHSRWTPNRADLRARQDALGIQSGPSEFLEVVTPG